MGPHFRPAAPTVTGAKRRYCLGASCSLRFAARTEIAPDQLRETTAPLRKSDEQRSRFRRPRDLRPRRPQKPPRGSVSAALPGGISERRSCFAQSTRAIPLRLRGVGYSAKTPSQRSFFSLVAGNWPKSARNGPKCAARNGSRVLQSAKKPLVGRPRRGLWRRPPPHILEGPKTGAYFSGFNGRVAAFATDAGQFLAGRWRRILGETDVPRSRFPHASFATGKLGIG